MCSNYRDINLFLKSSLIIFILLKVSSIHSSILLHSETIPKPFLKLLNLFPLLDISISKTILLPSFNWTNLLCIFTNFIFCLFLIMVQIYSFFLMYTIIYIIIYKVINNCNIYSIMYNKKPPTYNNTTKYHLRKEGRGSN